MNVNPPAVRDAESTAQCHRTEPDTGRDRIPGEWLLLLLLVTLLIPSPLIISGLGAAGNPSTILGLGILVLWFIALVRGNTIPRGSQPIRWIVGAYALTQTIAYGVGFLRGLPETEANASHRELMTLLASLGVTLFAADLIRTRRWLWRILIALSVFGAIQAIFGILQFYVHFDISAYIRIPGLSANAPLLEIASRGPTEVSRVAGTMAHYIEFGVVLALLAPIAVHVALFTKSIQGRIAAWSSTGLILIAIPQAVSRSGLVALAISLGTLAVVWPRRMKLLLGMAALVGLVVYPIISPGVLGTIGGLFTNADTDTSVLARLEDYEFVFPLIHDRPITGRGLGTFLPGQYILLDNQYLGHAVSSGILGAAGLVTLFLGGYVIGRSIRRRALQDSERHLGQAFTGTLLAAATVSFFFDSLSFSVFRTVVFLVLGLLGALWRLSQMTLDRPEATNYTPDDVVRPPWWHDLRPSSADNTHISGVRGPF